MQNRLRDETANLARALRNPGQGGRWDEMHLQQALEFMGMVKGTHFARQVATTIDGTRQPGSVARFLRSGTPQAFFMRAHPPLQDRFQNGHRRQRPPHSPPRARTARLAPGASLRAIRRDPTGTTIPHMPARAIAPLAVLPS